ncbi:MAG: succinate dehydrogenase, cytochrome b556 subunit [Steroidobacteraceae bacterium]
MTRRPLSPHLSVYRFMYTMTLSILHRITGVALSCGLILLVAWLVAASRGAESYARFHEWAQGNLLLQLLVALWLLALLYHLANGIRHLFWDADIGFERAQARRSGRLVVAFVVVAGSALLWFVFFGGRS